MSKHNKAYFGHRIKRLKKKLAQRDLEHLADILKERIYATIVLLAVLISIDINHTSPVKAAIIIGGTALSLWAASLVATRMSRHLVLGRTTQDESERRYLLRKHTPLLTAAVIPLFVILLAYFEYVSLRGAINFSIAASILLMLAWSIASARALQASKVPIIILAILELALALLIVGLKLLIGH